MKRLIHFFKTRKAIFWYRVVICACVLIFAGSLTKLILIFHEYNSASDEYQGIADEYVQNEQEGATGSAVSEDSVATPQENKNNFVFKQLNVDFESLKKTNKDVVGWIQFETFNLSYPIVRDSGDNYYLNHTFKKQKNSSGAIFIGPTNKSLQDTNTIIFGHNMKNGSMFGLLGRYKNKSYFPDNQYFWIYAPDTPPQRYQIFSVYKAAVNGSAYTVWSYAGGEKYNKWIQELKKNSMYDTGVSVSENDTIVTLSTCITGEDTKRLVVQAKRIE